MIKKINIIILLMQNCCSSRVLKGFYHAGLSQYVAEIYKDYFSAFSLKAQVRLARTCQRIYHYVINAFRCLPASSHPTVARFSNARG